MFPDCVELMVLFPLRQMQQSANDQNNLKEFSGVTPYSSFHLGTAAGSGNTHFSLAVGGCHGVMN